MVNGKRPPAAKASSLKVSASSPSLPDLVLRAQDPCLTLRQRVDPGTGKAFKSCADFDKSDVDSVVRSSQEAFLEFRKENPRSRAKKLLEWDRLIREHRDDLARIVTYETGKPLAEAQGELDYALGFTWWFAGEAERVRGTTSVPSTPNRRVFVVKQPIGVCAALVPWNFPVA